MTSDQTTTHYEIVRDVNELNDWIINDASFADLRARFREDDFAPTSNVEAEQVAALASRMLNVWSTQETAYRNGLITEEIYSFTRDAVVRYMQEFPALVPYFHAQVTNNPAYANFEALRPLNETHVE